MSADPALRHWFVLKPLIRFSDSEEVNRCWNSLVLAGRRKFSERMAKHKRHVRRSIIYVCVYTFWITLLRIRPPGKPDESGVDVLTVQYSRIRRAESERQVINTAVASRLRAQSDDFTCVTLLRDDHTNWLNCFNMKVNMNSSVKEMLSMYM